MNKWQNVLTIIGYLLIQTSHAAQSDFDKYFQLGLNAAATHRQQAQNAFNQFKAENTFNNYTNSPNESHYYEGVTQSSTTIKQDAVNQSANNDAANAIKKASA